MDFAGAKHTKKRTFRVFLYDFLNLILKWVSGEMPRFNFLFLIPVVGHQPWLRN
jgi:hypothetical protein